MRPRVAADFDDSALAQEFGRQGVGYLLAPEVLVGETEARHQVWHVGTIDGIEEHFYAISVERRITHACVLAITRAARGELFQPTERAERRHDARSDTLAGSAQYDINSGTVIVRVTPPRASSHRRE